MAFQLQLRMPGVPVLDAHRKCAIRSIDGRLAMTVPIADPEMEFSDLGQNWAVIDRGPLIGVPFRRGPRLSKATLRMSIAGSPASPSIAAQVGAVQAICDSLSAVMISYGDLEAKLTRSGAWVVTSGSVNVKARVQGSNDPRWAEVSLELLEYADFDDRHFVPPAGELSQASQRGSSSSPATYIWKAGDTLYGVASTVYGDGSAWTKIGDLNGVRDPAAIPPGTVLRLP